MRRIVSALRIGRGNRDRHLARKWQERLSHELDPVSARRARAFRARFAVRPEGDVIVLGHHLLSDPPPPIGVLANELLAQHTWVTGATGSGKTFFVLSLLLQLSRRAAHPVVILDLKGELSRILQEVALPALAFGAEDATLVERVRIIRPFGSDYVPLLRLTEREPGVDPEVQALSLASSLEEALGRDLGIRMERLFLKLCALAIELREPLTAIHRWLEQPVTLARDALRSEDARLRTYVRQSFEREAASSREALLARLDAFFLLRETRLALAASRCLSFAEMLASGITIINLGEPPAGAERVARFWAGVLVGRLARAVLSREVNRDTPQALIVLEEFQEALSGGQIDQFKRLLALARYKRVALWFVNQQIGQLSEVDPALPKVLRTNTSLEAIFRCNADDARALAPVMPVRSGRNRRALRDPVGEIMSLKDREYMLWTKREPFGPQRMRSPFVDLDALRRAGERLPAEVRQQLARGAVALPRRELEELLQGHGASAAPTLAPPLAANSMRRPGTPYPDLG